MKSIVDFRIKEVSPCGDRAVLLRLSAPGAMPECVPGQFVQVRVDGSRDTFLRRPISIHWADTAAGELWLLVQLVGEGTRRLGQLRAGDSLNLVMPLGNGFSGLDALRAAAAAAGVSEPKPLLVGGGVGVAPLYYYGAWLKARGVEPTFLLGARSKGLLLQLEAFEAVGRVFVTTEDGSLGERGFVTQHSVLSHERFTGIHVCGPAPMMKAVARYAGAEGIACEVSLENMMACGLGACLCCVEKTVRGNVCVCKEGPVFNINELTWN